MQLWDAFLEDYGNEIFNWSIRRTLELFWHYCQDGPKSVYAAIHGLSADVSPNKATPADQHEAGG